jgi:hypothetical protein
VLVTNLTAPVIAYTRKVEAVRLWDPVFLDGFAYELASRCAGKLGRSTSKAEKLHAQAMEMLESARRSTARSNRARPSRGRRRGSPRVAASARPGDLKWGSPLWSSA